MCVCIPIYIYIDVNVFIDICVFVPAHFCMHRSQQMYVCVYNVYIYIHMCSIVDLRLCSCVFVYVILCVM